MRGNQKSRHLIYKDASEIFQWLLYAKGQPVLTCGDIQAKDVKDQEQTLLKFNHPHRMLGLASQAQESKILAHMHGIRMAFFLEVLGR